MHFQITVFLWLYATYAFSNFLPFLQEETVEEFSANGTDPLTVSLYQMDLDRTQFLLRSYLRIRIQKVAITLTLE